MEQDVRQRKIYNIKAYLNGGYLKKYTYKEAWKNLWDSLNDDEKKAFEYLPNFDSEIFEDITGIKINQCYVWNLEKSSYICIVDYHQQ